MSEPESEDEDMELTTVSERKRHYEDEVHREAHHKLTTEEHEKKIKEEYEIVIKPQPRQPELEAVEVLETYRQPLPQAGVVTSGTSPQMARRMSPGEERPPPKKFRQPLPQAGVLGQTKVRLPLCGCDVSCDKSIHMHF